MDCRFPSVRGLVDLGYIAAHVYLLAVLFLPAVGAARKVRTGIRQEIEDVQRDTLRHRAERLMSKRYSGLHLKGPWRNKVSTAEGRFKVIQRVLVSEVQNAEAQR